MERDRELVEGALSGSGEAANRLVARLSPTIQCRVARVLLRRRPPGQAIRQEVEDLVQEIFAILLASDARLLRSWDPEAGLSLDNFIGLVAERRTTSILRSARRNPWTERPVQPADLDRVQLGHGPPVEDRDLLESILEKLEERLSPLGWRVFSLLFGAELSTEAISRELQISPNAIYTWRHRIIAKALEVRAELEAVGHGQACSDDR